MGNRKKSKRNPEKCPILSNHKVVTQHPLLTPHVLLINKENKLPYRHSNVCNKCCQSHISWITYTLCIQRQEGTQKRLKPHLSQSLWFVRNRSIQNHGTNSVERTKYANIYKNCQNGWEKSVEDTKIHERRPKLVSDPTPNVGKSRVTSVSYRLREISL